MHVLVADDDRDTVDTQAVLLRRRGFSVVTCTEGNDVMPLVEKYRPEVMLLDLAMPGMSGFDVAEELKENPDLRPKLLIALTGFGDNGTKEMTAQAGFDHHLVKPLHLLHLLVVLATVYTDVQVITATEG